MKILALEFSSPQRSVAVLSTETGRPRAASEVVETSSHATRPWSMIAEALREAKLEREEIDGMALGLGPGSYTGIRTALALAQGWQLARPVKLAGFSSAEILAAQAKAENLTGTVGVVIDAQRGELYFAVYEVSEAGWTEVTPLKILTPGQVTSQAEAGVRLVGPEATRWFAGGKQLFPRAATLAELAATRGEFADGGRLEPIYLRPTQFVKAPKPRFFP